jgi:hypothetical protein
VAEGTVVTAVTVVSRILAEFSIKLSDFSFRTACLGVFRGTNLGLEGRFAVSAANLPVALDRNFAARL